MVQESRQNSTGSAIAYLLFGVIAGLGLDLCAKGLLATYSLEQFVFLRSLIGLGIFILLGHQFGGIRSLITSRWPWHLLRTLLATGAMFGFFYGLSRMPLVDALTLGFTAPLMVTALSVPMLGEHVGWRRWIAVTFGFVGVLIILRPGAGEVTFASLAVLFAAFCYACMAISARHLSTTESSYALSVYVIAGPLLVSLVHAWPRRMAGSRYQRLAAIRSGRCMLGHGLDRDHWRLSACRAGAIGTVRIHRPDRRCDRGLSDLG